MARKVKYQSVNPVNWENTPTLEGVLTERREVEVDGRKTPAIVLSNAEGLWLVYQSSLLEEAFTSAEIGDTIRIVCTGTKPLKGNRTLRLFQSAVYAPEE